MLYSVYNVSGSGKEFRDTSLLVVKTNAFSKKMVSGLSGDHKGNFQNSSTLSLC